MPWWKRLFARWRHSGSTNNTHNSRTAPSHDEAAAVRRSELLARQARIDDILARPQDYPHFTDEDRQLLRRIRDNLAESAGTLASGRSSS